MKRKSSTPATVSVVILVLILAWAVAPELSTNLLSARAQQKQVRKPRRYACPMHPEVTSTRPGKCPKCGMALRLVEDTVNSNTVGVPPPPRGDPASISSKIIPDVQVYDQSGKRLSFYSDLVKGKTVAINFIFTTCTGVCPPMTATFRKVQEQLAEKGSRVQLISISVDPTTDTPERLREFAAKFNAAPDWAFVTGDKSEIDTLLQALGVAVANKNDHTPMILIGNDLTDYWTRAYGLSWPTTLVNVITDVATRKQLPGR